ncbi:MAG: TrkA family potassium uptake protein [Lachnospiraceae bacterium]|nr:TrkA family potassium uptake protein [Lachnospiraceae bacterium]
MKSFLIIGLGRFGHYLCRQLAELGNEILAVDAVEERLEPCLPLVTSAQIGDCTKPEVLRELGVRNFDSCFVCIGTNFQSSLEITSLLKELGAKRVVSRASTDVQAKFLLRNGADEVVYPERDMAEKVAKKSSANHVFDFVDLGDYGIYEVLPPKSWVDKSIRELNVRVNYNVSILGVREKDGSMRMPDAEYCFQGQDHMLVMGSDKDLARFLKKV